MRIQEFPLKMYAGLFVVLLMFAVSCDSVTSNFDESSAPPASLSEYGDLQLSLDDEEVCETAFAFGGDDGTCFLDFEDLSANRWGWTNGPLEEGSYEFEIYTGAGQCDLSKGTHVGTLYVEYEDGEVKVTYELFDGFSLTEVHIYVGNDPLPTRSQGRNGEVPTVAPGQYTYTNDNLNYLSSYYQEFYASGEIYVIAHAVVCEACVPSSIVYGIQSYEADKKGNIYIIDPITQEEVLLFAPPAETFKDLDWWYPNALALDQDNRRMYFTSGPSTLLFYDMESGELENADPDNKFTNTNQILGAAFGGGYYWYIVNQSGDLGRVSFDANGIVTSVVKDEMDDDLIIGMGDIVYKDGIIYGSSGTTAPNTQNIFFTFDTNTFDTDTKAFNSFDRGDERALQLAWGLDEDDELVLYGHLVAEDEIDDVSLKEWYTVDITNGDRTFLNWVSDNRYEDLASEVKLCH